ncbi:hypothetical protein QP400_00415 [Winkia sp. UMB3158]|uniref:HK97 gp10 family phage protein n=9 Tax=Bacillati TaxID=1783272 RepID=A0AAW6Y253_STRAG|nr:MULTISPECIES: hypothetical protein [Terrabacteria group]MDK8341215.1 hypothetical protein [Winkia sp. UMB3164B]OFT55539.1 hypothetical protein HMPREF3152_04545 [Actinomyces sp. HMSC06A08]MDK6240169.1 hypothetical protein [Winkia sp. UMB10116]MDK6471383.1 hypothetical protein [Streptococcus agalactiae]MDK6900352.1 hypothetical protein [Streptococcus agalactiae]
MGTSLTWNGAELLAAVNAGARVGLNKAAEHLRGVSQAQAPIDEGILRATASVTVDSTGLKAAVSYDTVYAARQHEELTWRHPKGGNAKYLEKPAREEAQTMVDLIAAEVRRAT